MTKKQQFHDLCEAQIERLNGAFPDFRFTKLGGVQELVAWLEDHAKGDRSQANQFITAVTEFPTMPTIAQLNALWYQMFPNRDTVARADRESCTRCHGTGWITVAGPYGTSAAYSCTHAEETEADRRMGVRISPALDRHYRQEAQQADQSQAAFMQRRANGLKGFHRVTQDDVDSLLAGFGI